MIAADDGVYAPDKGENAAVALLHIRETFRVGCHFIQHRAPADAEARILVLAAEYLGIGARGKSLICVVVDILIGDYNNALHPEAGAQAFGQKLRRDADVIHGDGDYPAFARFREKDADKRAGNADGTGNLILRFALLIIHPCNGQHTLHLFIRRYHSSPPTGSFLAT